MRIVFAAAAVALTSACHMTAPIGSQVVGETTIGEDKILVGTLHGGWFANTVGKPPYPPATRLKLIQAIESASGCLVIRETVSGGNNAITASVSCS